ncbi:MAG: GNAT family N-acetyltransferase [Solirubrobacteraceae bacterium]
MTSITRHGAEVIGELRPFWLAMVAHHAVVAPEMGPVRDDEDTWSRRREHYERQLARPHAFVLLARVGGRAVGYALVTIEEASPTWSDPDGWAEIDSLALLPEARGQGIGEQMIERVQTEVGDRELRLFAMAGNADALRFYERQGFRTAIVVMRRPLAD